MFHLPSGHSELSDALLHLMEASMAVAFLAYKARQSEGGRLSDAGLTRRGVLTETVLGCLIGFALISAVVGILSRDGVYHAAGINRRFEPWLPLLKYFGVAVFEEALFRGFLFRSTEKRCGSLLALLVSSLAFGLLHILNVANSPIPVWQKLAGPLFICLEAGLLLGAAYMATRRLWLPIGIHWAWNFFEGPVYGTDVSGNAGQSNVLVHSSLQGPFLLTGGQFGPEGSVACAGVGLMLGAGMLWVALRRGEWKAATTAKRLSR